MHDLEAYIPKVHFEQIPIRNLVSHQEYQRNLSESHIRRTIENFDLHQINPVKVSRRDGVNYIFNGQHTVEIVAIVSGSRDTPVWCMIYDELIYEQEADIFANQQKFTRSLKPYEIFMANIEAGNDEQLIIKSLVEFYGLNITSGKAPGGICAVGTLEYIYQNHGFHVLDRTLRLCIGTWEGDEHSLTSSMLKGVAHLVVAYEDFMRDDIFKEKVGAFSSRDIGRTAKERKAGSMGYAEAIINIYNKKMRPASCLKWGILYAYKSKTAKPINPEGDEAELTDDTTLFN